MGCCSCVKDLAYKLLEHHKNLDLLRAFELAEKAVERVENREKPQSPQILSGKGNPSDYTQLCVGNCAGGACSCYTYTTSCTRSAQCYKTNTCAGGACDCPDPLPNSHWVSDTCNCVASGCLCFDLVCIGTCSCGCSGTCWYDCDEGYVWNPVTHQCEIPAPPAKETIGDGIVFATV
jgi:hypothetical protein